MADQRDPQQYARDIETVVQDALYNIAQSVGDAINDAMGNVQDVSDYTLKDIKRGFADLSKINSVMARATLDASQGEFTRAKATKIILDRKAKERALESAISILKSNIREDDEAGLRILKEREADLQEIRGYNKEIESSLNEQVRASQKINQAQGLSGAALSGLQKLASKAGLGGLSDVFDNAKAASTSLADKLTQGGKKSASFLGKSRIAAKGMSVAFKGALGYLAGPVGIAMLLGKAVKFLLSIDERAANLAKSLNMTKVEAANFDREILRASGGIDYLNNRLGEAAELAGSFADNTGIISTNLRVFNADLGVINRRFGLSEQQTSEIAKNMLISGQSSTEFAANALGAAEALEMQNGINIQSQAIMRDIADLSALQFLNLNKQPGAIAKAVTQARRFGLTMSTLEGIQGNLLNFSQSITDEINAELLLGRQLNLDRARAAALNNDYATVAAEISKEIGGAAEFAELNAIQQQALAKAAGMTVQELAKALKEQEALEKAGYSSAAAREKEFLKLKEIYGEQEALRRIGMEEFTRQKQNISFQEKLNNLLHNMKMIFVQSINPILQEATSFLESNPQFLKESLDYIKDLALKVSDFVTQLYNGGPAIDALAKKFEKFGFVTDMFKEFLPYDEIQKQVAAITDTQLKAIGVTRDEYQQILAQANQEQGAFGLGSGSMLVTNKTIRESRDMLKEFNKTLNTAQDKAATINEAKKANETSQPLPLAKSAAAGKDLAQKINTDAQGNYVDEKGTIYQNSTSKGVSTTTLPVEQNTNLKQRESDLKNTSVSIKTTDTSSKNQAKITEDTNKLLTRLIEVVEAGGDVFIDGRKVGEALVLGHRSQ